MATMKKPPGDVGSSGDRGDDCCDRGSSFANSSSAPFSGAAVPPAGISGEDLAENFIQAAGINVSDMDPISLIVLKEHLNAKASAKENLPSTMARTETGVAIDSFAGEKHPGIMMDVDATAPDFTTSGVSPTLSTVDTKPPALPTWAQQQKQLYEDSFPPSSAAGAVPVVSNASLGASRLSPSIMNEPRFEDLTPEEKLLHFMQQQNDLIVDLHRRVDELNHHVQYLTQNLQNLQTTTSSATKRTRSIWMPTSTQVNPPPQQPPEQNPQVQQPQVQARQPQQQQPPQERRARFLMPLLARIWESIAAWFGGIHDMRLLRMTRLFWGLQNRQVRNLDMGMVLKVLVMMAIFMSRMSRNHISTGGGHTSGLDKDAYWWFKIAMTVSFIILGFMYHSGHLQFIYKFFVQKNYAGRIWNGEDLSVDDVIREEEEGYRPRPHPQPRPPQPGAGEQQQPPRDRAAPGGGGVGGQHNINDAGAADAGPNGPRQQAPMGFMGMAVAAFGDVGRWINNLGNTLLGGQIAQPNPLAGNLNFGLDILVLFASFFLSIFPMWRPARMEIPQPPQDPPADGGDGNDGPHPQQQQHRQLPQHQPRDDPIEIPHVRPPQDAFEAADDDDDDD